MGTDKEMTGTINERDDNTISGKSICLESPQFQEKSLQQRFGNEKWIVEVPYISTKCSTYIKWDACKSLTGLNQGSYQNDSST